MSNIELATRIREVIVEIRRRPYPISDLIPLLARAADALHEEPKTERDYSKCNNVLASEGKPYPRTCQICKLDRCMNKVSYE